MATMVLDPELRKSSFEQRVGCGGDHANDANDCRLTHPSLARFAEHAGALGKFAALRGNTTRI